MRLCATFIHLMNVPYSNTWKYKKFIRIKLFKLNLVLNVIAYNHNAVRKSILLLLFTSIFFNSWPTYLNVSVCERLYANWPRTMVACTTPFNCLPMYGLALLRKWMIFGVTVKWADGSQIHKSASYPLRNFPLQLSNLHSLAGASHIKRIISSMPKPCFLQCVQNSERPWTIMTVEMKEISIK